VGQRVERIQRPTGLVERDLFMITQTFIDAPSGDDPAAIEKLDSLQRTDLVALRRLPDVASATPINTLPLLRSRWGNSVGLKPDQARGVTQADTYTGGEQMLQSLGLQLVAGRDFTSADVRHGAEAGIARPPVVVVTRALADRLFPHGDALGKSIYLGTSSVPSVIVGEVARMLTSNPDENDAFAYHAVLIPLRIDAASTAYAVRARPGQMQAAIREARKMLFQLNPLRIIPPGGRYSPEGIRTFAQIRSWGYALDLFMVQVLTVICVILLLITGVGMAGLTSFWVNQRHRQIGIRRALGARKVDILRYFQIENLLIAGSGCIVGVGLAIGINLALLRAFAMDRMPFWYVLAGVAVVLALGQIAAFAPARRASQVPPVVATRAA
jgi:putative ABC transport system permease protein